jgi:2-polyprenyl-3-methyl-5-hydroxy-6-metoxy-1,4-benzoquinol methylase
VPTEDSDARLDDVVERIRKRVEERRRAGAYPEDLEEVLDEHFKRLVGSRPESSPAVFEELDALAHQLTHFRFAREIPSTSSNIPGGELAHNTLNRVFARQVDGIIGHLQHYASIVARSTTLLTEVALSIAHEFNTKVLQQLDDLQLRLAEQKRTLNRLDSDLLEMRSRVAASTVDPWYQEDHFTAKFRGSSDELRARYESLADVLVGQSPVVDIGFGRGEFIDLLVERGVEARGVEPDPLLVESARARGLDVVQGYAVQYLRGLPAHSLGGLVMIQVVEHLPPQQLIDLVEQAGEKIRSGGKVVIETINPMSLYAYARAFWLDPDHSRPVHPAFLEFLFREAGFQDVYVEWRSPVPDDERLEKVSGDDDTTDAVNRNFERIESLVFAPQDYALIATR